MTGCLSRFGSQYQGFAPNPAYAFAPSSATAAYQQQQQHQQQNNFYNNSSPQNQVVFSFTFIEVAKWQTEKYFRIRPNSKYYRMPRKKWKWDSEKKFHRSRWPQKNTERLVWKCYVSASFKSSILNTLSLTIDWRQTQWWKIEYKQDNGKAKGGNFRCWGRS